MASPPRIPTPPPRFYSDYARKYGLSSPFRHLARSGLTPTSPLFPSTTPFPVRPTGFSDRLKSESYQRGRFCGFTTRELINLDAVSDRSLKPSSLKRHVVPFLEVENWDDGTGAALFRIGGGALGDERLCSDDNEEFWRAKNPRIGAILGPVVNLASRLLTGSVFGQFFDAVLHADCVPVELDRIPDKIRYDPNFGPEPDEMEKIYPPSFDAQQQANVANERESIMRDMKRYMRFTFMDCVTDVFDGGDEKLNYVCGYTTPKYDPTPGVMGRPPWVRNIWVCLNLHYFAPLLRDDLTDAERFGLTWFNANTLVHECLHAFEMIIRMRTMRDANGQMYLFGFAPYYQEEPISEEGYAMEYHVGGGVPFAMADDGQGVHSEGPPLGFFHNTIWCTTEHQNVHQGWQLLRPPLTMEQRFFPIPVRLFEDMHQEDFWTHLRKFKCKLHEVRAISSGVSVTLDLHGNRIDSEEILENPLLRLKHMLELMEMSPADKNTLAVGKAINESAVSGHAYWDGSRESTRGAAEIIQLLRDYTLRVGYESDDSNASSGGSPFHVFEDQQLLYNKITKQLKDIALSHWKTINALITQEQTAVNGGYNIDYTQNRANLVVFNRGTRHFISEIQGEIEDPDLSFVRATYKSFEYCHLKIWKPNTASNPRCADRNEYQWVDDLYAHLVAGNFAGFKIIYDQLDLTADISWYNLCRLRIMYNSWNEQIHVGLGRRLQEFTEALNDLQQLKREPTSAGGCSEVWKAPLDHWIRLAQTAISAVNIRIVAARA